MSLLEALILSLKNIQEEETSMRKHGQQSYCGVPLEESDVYSAKISKDLYNAEKLPVKVEDQEMMSPSLVKPKRKPMIEQKGFPATTNFNDEKVDSTVVVDNQNSTVEKHKPCYRSNGKRFSNKKQQASGVTQKNQQDQNKRERSNLLYKYDKSNCDDEQYELESQEKIRKRVKLEVDEESIPKRKHIKVSKYFDPKPYIMRRIKQYIRQKLMKQEQDQQLTEQYFRKNINEEYYRNTIFNKYIQLLNKTQMFNVIKNQLTQELQNQQSKILLNQLRRVELQYTYDTKTTQKAMWSVLSSKLGYTGAQLTSYKKSNYLEIAKILKQINLGFLESSSKIFWDNVSKQLLEKNPLKYDPFQVETIRNQFFRLQQQNTL